MVGGLTRTTFQVGYLLEVSGEVRATAVTVHGAVDGAGRPSRMPAFLADLVGSGGGRS
jgi:acyl-CoA thioesterase FadM